MIRLLFEKRSCLVVWCTQNLRQDGCSFMWHQPCQRCKYTTSVGVFFKRCEKLVTHVEPHAGIVSLLKRVENSSAQAIISHSTQKLLFPEKYWQGLRVVRSQEIKGMNVKSTVHLMLHCHHQDDSCIKMGRRSQRQLGIQEV